MPAVQIQGHVNNTPDEVRDWLEQAQQICSDVYGDDGPPTPVVVKVLELLASKTMVTLQAAPMPFDPELARHLGRSGGRH